MGHHCCVPRCSSNSRHSGNGAITFHAFPVDPKERKLWIHSVRRADYKKLTVNKHTKVCSKHFRDEDFIHPQYSKRRMLKKGVVPSVFVWTRGNQEVSQCEKKTKYSSDDPGYKALKEESKLQISGDSSSNAGRTEPCNTKEADRKLSGKGKGEVSASRSSAIAMEKKTKHKSAKKEINISSDTHSDNLPMASSSCLSSTKSDDSEQGSVSDMTPANGSSPNSSCNSTSGRKQASALIFEIGTRLEAKDLGSEIWYPVKVVEVDWDDEEILIHFEKWSQRYDEWIPMDSSRLRVTQNPSPQNDSKTVSKVFSVGDRVMAKWSDCRRYPAKVKAVLGNDRYEVLFFDGFTKNMKGIRMSKLEGEADKVDVVGPVASERVLPPPVIKPVIKNEVISEAIGTKQERRERKRKLNVVELFHPKKRLKLDSEVPSDSKSSSEVEKGKKAEKGKQRSESHSNVNEVHNEGEKSSVNVDTNGTLAESVHGSKVDETLEDSEGGEDAVGRSKKKTGARSGGGASENADRSQHGGLQQGEAEQKAKTLEVKSDARKIPRKVFLGFQESDSVPSRSRWDSIKGKTQEEGAPRKRRKHFLDSSSKSVNRLSRKENGKEEIMKRQTDGRVGYTVESVDGPRKTTVVPDKNLPSGWSKHTIQRTHGNSAGKWDVILVNPQGRRFRSRNELRLFFEENGEPYKAEMFDFCLSGKKRMSRTPDGSTASGKKMSRGPGIRAKTAALVPGGDAAEQLPLPLQQKQQLQPQRRVKILLPKVRQTSASQGEDDSGENHTEPSSPPPPYTATVAPVPANNIQIEILEGEVLVGGLKIQMENNTFKCPKEGCGKNFRKENLLQMHLKHYHPEYNKLLGSTPNVADLAYARTVGESIDDLMPKVRYSGVGSVGVGGTLSYSEKTNRFEPNRKYKTGMGAGVGSGKSGGLGASGSGDVSTGFEKKKVTVKEKQQSAVTTKKPGKGMVSDGEGQAPADDMSGEDKEQGEEKLTGVDNRENTSTPVADAAPAITHKEEKKEPQTTIKTLLPVIRSPSHAQEIPATERLKSKFPTVEEGEEYIEVINVGARQIPPTHSTGLLSVPQTSVSTTQSTTSLTKSLRTIRRRRLSDFHFEPLHKRRKITSASKLDMSEDVDVTDDGGTSVDGTTPTAAAGAAGTVGVGRGTNTMYRYSKKKTPVVHLEKLNIITDSNGRIILSPSAQDQPERKLLETPERSPVEHLRKEELINCKCGYMEEDGLMIQCDICLCWQHGLCNNIKKETEVPEKYVCSFCLNPVRQRKSKKFLHDQDWLKEGKLPSLSFRSKNESNIREREAILKRSHELTGSLLQIQQVLHSLRVKVNIAGKPDHPKLYLWAKSWEKEGEGSSVSQISASHSQAVIENELKSQLENAASCCHNEKKPASDTNMVLKNEVPGEKDVMPDPGHSENGGVANMCMMKQDSKMEEKEMNLELQVPEETIVVEVETSEVDSSADAVKYQNMSEVRTSKKNNETDIEITTAENVDANDALGSGMGSSLSNNQRVSSSNDHSITDTTALAPSENREHESVEDTDKPQSVTNVHECDQEAHPAIEQEESCEEVAENLEVQSEKQERCDSDICLQKKQDVMDMYNPGDVRKQHDQSSVEETLKSSSEEKSDETTSQLEGHGLLHHALTNGSQVTNPLNGSIGGQLDTSGHPMLQLPICQSELMQFASTMADNLTVTESARPDAAAPVPVSEPPRAPQPEAPIDPVECRLRLLDHIDHFQTQIDTRLTMLEEQVAALESQDPDAAKDEAPDFYPQTKQAIQMLLRDLISMRKIAALN